MVDGVNKTGPLGGQTFSNKGIKLEELKGNKLLFDYFKKAGLDEKNFVYETDIAKLKEVYDKNENGKFSVKEAKAMGLEGSRKEIKNAIKILQAIETTEIASDKALIPAKVSDKETNYFDKKGTLVQNRITLGENAYIRKTFSDGNPEKLLAEFIQDGPDKQRYATYKDANPNQPETVFERNGDISKETKYHWHGDNLNYTEEREGGKKTTTIYENYNFKDRPVKTVIEAGNAITSIENEYEGDKLKTQLVTNPDGTKTKSNYENGKIISKEEVVDIKPKPESQDTINKQAETKTNNDTKPVVNKINIPEDWNRVPTSFRIASKVTETKNAEDSAVALMKQNNIDEKVVDKEKFVKDLIKFNPSIYDEKGNVKDSAKWNKLDLPKHIAEQYKAKAGDATPTPPSKSKTSKGGKTRPEEPEAPKGDGDKKGIPYAPPKTEPPKFEPPKFEPPEYEFPGLRKKEDDVPSPLRPKEPTAPVKPKTSSQPKTPEAPKGDGDKKGIPYAPPKTEPPKFEPPEYEFPGLRKKEDDVPSPLRPKEPTAPVKPKKEPEQQAKLWELIPQMKGNIKMSTQNGKTVYSPITGPLAGRIFDTPEAMKVALDIQEKFSTAKPVKHDK